MKITATPKVSYTLTIGKHEINASVVSEWEGFTKLRTEKLGVLIVRGLKPGPGMQGAFHSMFNDIFGKTEIDVVMASPDLAILLGDGLVDKTVGEFREAMDSAINGRAP